MTMFIPGSGRVPVGNELAVPIAVASGRPPAISVLMADSGELGMPGGGKRVVLVTSVPATALLAFLTLDEVACLEDELRRASAQLAEAL